MSLFGFIENVEQAVGGPFTTLAVDGGKALAKIFSGQTVAGQASMSPEAIVKMITQGAGPQGLAGEQQDNAAKATVQNQIETATRQHMTTIESAWTGSGADAARDKLQAATVPVAASSQAMNANANTINGQVESFTTLKNSLHTDVTNNPPQKNIWDDITPWDTNTEKAINANNAKVQENLQAYNTYAQSSQTNAPQLKTNYGQVTDLSGGNFQLQQPATPGPGPTTGPGGTGGSGGNGRYGSANVPNRTGRGSMRTGGAGGSGLTTGSGSGLTTGNISGSLNDGTSAAGYTTPGAGSSNYGPSGLGSPYNPSGSGGSSDFSAGGFGPMGGGFGPVGSGSAGGLGSGSGSGGYGSGSSASGSATGSGALTGGKATGGAVSEAGAAGAAAKAGAAGTSGTAGRGGMGGMGHGGKGEGGEDEEHQRPAYLIEEDPDGLFGTDEKTAPPVIGL